MKRLSLLFVIVAGLLVAGAVASALPAADEPMAIPVGVTIGGVQVGGLAPDAATAAVQQAFETPLELELGTTRVLVTPDVLVGIRDRVRNTRPSSLGGLWNTDELAIQG